MVPTRVLDAALNAAFTFVVTYAVARFRGADTPLRAGLFGAAVIGALSYARSDAADTEDPGARAYGGRATDEATPP